MSGEVVKIKGARAGLQLVFDDTADFASIERDLRGKLESGSKFFYRGTVIRIPPNRLGDEEQAKLTELFHKYGVFLRTSLPEPPKAKRPRPRQAVRAEKMETPEHRASIQEMTVVDRTLRGGQEIRTEGSVLICGNVNPSAQIIAGGSIDIRGTCRGIVHAGAYGNRKAFIIADRLMPMQIRIADIIAQAPDMMEKPDRAERAFIKDGRIVIEPMER